jgi:hypothetical protein
MTTPPDAPPPVDPGNQLLAETSAQLTTGLIQTPAGQRLALTIRTPSTTLTVLLQQGDARAWAAGILGAANQMSSSGLIVANGSGMPQAT